MNRLLAPLLLMLLGCDSKPAESPAQAETPDPAFVVSPNLWTWSSRHYSNRSLPTYAWFDQRGTPPAMIVGRVPPYNNMATEFFSFEVLTRGRTIHLKSFAAFQPHANCISGDFELAIEHCREGARLPLCATLIDLESGLDLRLSSHPRFDVDMPAGWQPRYSQDPTLGGVGETLSEHLDLRPLLAKIDDQHYREDRERATSRFLKGAFDIRARLQARAQTPRVANRRCVDSGRGVIAALRGNDNARVLSVELPE